MENIVTLNHGSGGRITHRLITDIFRKYFNNSELNKLTDASIVPVEGTQVAFTTDAYVVDPIFFPGGNIGKLAVCGTVNDLAVSGAVPNSLSASFILEEGFSLQALEEIVASMAQQAKIAGVSIVTGDTKVVNKGKADKIFITTSGIGNIEPRYTGIGEARSVKAGFKLIINGSIGEHAIAILASREALKFETSVESDCAALNHLIAGALKICPEIGFMRDATRGGLATVLCELAEKTNLGIALHESAIPVKDNVQAICELFGFDPLFLANEGKVVMAVPENYAEILLSYLQHTELGRHAAIIGELSDNKPGKVILHTATGGKRIIDMPEGSQLPRIC